MTGTKKLDRREFLKSSVAGTLGGGIYLNSFNFSGEEKTKEKEKKIEYRQLGNIGYKVSLLGFGAMLTDEPPVLAKALDMGINYVDTSRGYKNGNNEKMISKVIKGRRDKVFLTTKTGLKSSTEEILKDAETSLKALETDYVDCYLIKSLGVRENVFDENALKALEKLKKDGKTRYVGIATHKNEAEVVGAMIETGFYDLVTVAYNFRSSEELTNVLKKARKSGIAVVAMKNMGGRGGEGFDAGMKGLNHFQAGLRWVMNQEFVDTTIPSIKSFKELDENFGVMGTNMSWSDRKTLYNFAKATDDSYCRRCGQCSDACPYGTNVSDIMRYLMYAEGYGELELGKSSYGKLASSERASNCIDCDKCIIPCKHGLNIRKRMVYAHSLLA